MSKKRVVFYFFKERKHGIVNIDKRGPNMKKSDRNMLFVVLGLFAVLLLFCICVVTRQRYLDIFYFFGLSLCFLQYLYVKRKS